MDKGLLVVLAEREGFEPPKTWEAQPLAGRGF